MTPCGSNCEQFTLSLPDPTLRLAARILRGESAATIPVTQGQAGRTLPLIVDLRAARALGITIPPSILVQACEVIQ